MSDATHEKNTSTASVAVMNQLPAGAEAESLAQSPLFHANFAALAQKTVVSDSSVSVQEGKLLGHLAIRANADDKQFSSAFKSVLGVELPSTLQSARSEEISIYWISPDEWLVVCPGERAFSLEQELRSAMSGHFSIVNVSGGQTMLTLSGEHAREVLMKSTPYDVSDHNFPVAKVVTSVMAKSQAIICRKSDTTWELIIRRTFSDYLWLWLQRACEEYGLIVQD